VNGIHVHKCDDYEKMTLLNTKGWRYYSIWIENGVTEKNNFELIREQIDILCKAIKKDIINCT
ncbi:MAG TPA: hypothetical protein VHT96_15965, partial [Clostridia bacterium]|nr:hypothetical protein [Clostridia bacterium]